MKICNKMFAECLGTFVLVLGGCGTALFGHVGFLGVAIAFGLTLVLIHLISIPLTNTSVNPARSLSQALFSNADGWCAMGQLWLFIVAPLVGAGLAGLAYKCLAPKEK
jgi:aquaporin Z